jgi:hypothetical protein
MASIRVDMDHMTSSSKHGSIRQPSTIINIAPNIVLNPLIVENHPPSKSSGFHNLRVSEGDEISFLVPSSGLGISHSY